MQRPINVDEDEKQPPSTDAPHAWPKQEFDAWQYMQRKFEADEDEDWHHFTVGGRRHKGRHSKLHKTLCWLVQYGPLPLLARWIGSAWGHCSHAWTSCKRSKAQGAGREGAAAEEGRVGDDDGGGDANGHAAANSRKHSWSQSGSQPQRASSTRIAPIRLRQTLFGWPVLHPDSTRARIWQVSMLILDLSYTAFLVPIIIAFSNDLLQWQWLNIVDVVGGSLYMVDVMMGFTIGVRVRWRQQEALILDGVLVAEYYLCKSSALGDMIAALPTIPVVVLLCIPGLYSYTASLILNLLRLLRFLRLPRALSQLYSLSLLVLMHLPARSWVGGLINAITMFYFNFLFLIFVLVNGLACLWFFVADMEQQHGNMSWVDDAGLTGASSMTLYWAAVNFAMATVTTIGYGNISPSTVAEFIVSSLIMLIGVFVFGVLLSSLGDMLRVASGRIRKAVALRDKLSNIEVWSSRRNFPQQLMQDIRAYFIETWPSTKEHEHERTEFLHLPDDLRHRVAWHICGHVLQSNSVFKRLPEHHQETLAARLVPIFVPRGVNLAAQGTPADCIWVLQDGVLRVLHNTHEVDVVHAPCIVGQAALLEWIAKEKQTRPATLRALTNCYLWKLSMHELVPLLESHPPMVQHMAQYFATRIETQLQRVDPVARAASSQAMWMRLLEELHAAASDQAAGDEMEDNPTPSPFDPANDPAKINPAK